MAVELFHCSGMDVLSAVRIAKETARREGFKRVAERDEVIESALEALINESGIDDLILTTKKQLLDWLVENI